MPQPNGPGSPSVPGEQSATATVKDKPFPLTTPAGSDASMFLQWKGTDVCLDFYCACGRHGHFDGDFAYSLRCPACGTVYEMGTQVIVKRTEDVHLVEYARTLEVEGINDPAFMPDA